MALTAAIEGGVVELGTYCIALLCIFYSMFRLPCVRLPSVTPVVCTGAAVNAATAVVVSFYFGLICKRFPVADEVSIRDGLMYSFAGMWYGDTDALRGQEARRGRALECALFSSVAIGGLLSGCPPETIAKHVATAQASMVEFRGLSDRHAVSALILHGMMNVLLPLSGSNAEGRKSLDEAQAIFESMPDRDPLLSVILAFRRQVENLSLLKVDTIGCSSSTAGASKGHQPSAASFNSPPSSTSANTEEGEAILKGVEIHHGPNQRTPSQHAHPAYVVADGTQHTLLLLVL